LHPLILGIYKEFGKKEIDWIPAYDGKPEIPGEVTVEVCNFLNAFLLRHIICIVTVVPVLKVCLY